MPLLNFYIGAAFILIKVVGIFKEYYGIGVIGEFDCFRIVNGIEFRIFKFQDWYIEIWNMLAS